MSSLIIFLPAIDLGPATADRFEYIGLILFLLMVNILLNLPVDILSSYAVFRIGQGLRLRSAWLAWIPVGNLWVMGCIADDYQKLVKGRKSYMRWILPLNVVWAVSLWFVAKAVGAAANSGPFLAELLLLVPVLLLSIGGIVAVYIALYRVYRYSLKKGAAIAFTALGVIYGFPTPIFLLGAASEW